MDINTLEKNLTQATQDFADSVQSNIKNRSSENVTYDDYEELARDTFYALNQMKAEIVKYLREL